MERPRTCSIANSLFAEDSSPIFVLVSDYWPLQQVYCTSGTLALQFKSDAAPHGCSRVSAQRTKQSKEHSTRCKQLAAKVCSSVALLFHASHTRGINTRAKATAVARNANSRQFLPVFLTKYSVTRKPRSFCGAKTSPPISDQQRTSLSQSSSKLSGVTMSPYHICETS